jgi:hypothetical protein
MLKHSPAPWKTDVEYDHETVIDAHDKMVADCCISSQSTGKIKANAKLISLAPDMYLALRRIAVWDFDIAGDCVKDAQDMAQAILKKIEEA